MRSLRSTCKNINCCNFSKITVYFTQFVPFKNFVRLTNTISKKKYVLLTKKTFTYKPLKSYILKLNSVKCLSVFYKVL